MIYIYIYFKDRKWAGLMDVFDTDTFNNGIAFNLSYICLKGTMVK